MPSHYGNGKMNGAKKNGNNGAKKNATKKKANGKGSVAMKEKMARLRALRKK